ncbi:MAG: DUF1236 domain-containing protein [Siculibacillus sp.]|nr:DUF1236 domain-containing protein [Siculibacillus sp.]
MRRTMIAAAMAAMFGSPMVAGAQGVAAAAAEVVEADVTVEDWTRAAGPVGTVFDGLFGIDQRPRFREYAVRRHHPSYTFDREMVIGAVLPARGVTYHDVPPEFGVRAFRYAIVNERPVLVDPTTRRIVDILE